MKPLLIASLALLFSSCRPEERTFCGTVEDTAVIAMAHGTIAEKHVSLRDFSGKSVDVTTYYGIPTIYQKGDSACITGYKSED